MKKTIAFPACFALFASMLVAGVCFGQSAAESQSAAASVVECTHVADRNARLQCYDDHMARLGHAISPAAPAASASRVPPGATAPAPVSKQPEFAVAPSALRKQRAAEDGSAKEAPQELVAKVKSVSTRQHGELVVELDNDQVWLETNHSNYVSMAAGETVTIKRGALGSYFLSRKAGAALRVERIK